MSLVPRPTLFFFLLFGLHWQELKQKSSKHGEGLGAFITWATSSGRREGRAQPQVSLKHGGAELSTASRVSTNSEALKPSQLDNELIKDQQNRLWTPAPYIHLTSTWCHSSEECSQAFPVFHCTSASMHYCQRKLKSEKRGRSGDKAITTTVIQSVVSTVI